jgi:hypothetical protein
MNRHVTGWVLACCLGLSMTAASAQPALTFGSSGFGFKTRAEAGWRLALRTGAAGFGAGAGDVLLTAQPELVIARSWLRSDPAYPYIGLGVQSRLTWQQSGFTHQTALMIPAGIEVFPFSSRRVSFTVEARLLRTLGEGSQLKPGGMVELGWYLSRRAK